MADFKVCERGLFCFVGTADTIFISAPLNQSPVYAGFIARSARKLLAMPSCQASDFSKRSLTIVARGLRCPNAFASYS